MDEDLLFAEEDYEEDDELSEEEVNAELGEEEEIGYKQGISFDSDFIRDGQNRLQTSTGLEAWYEWCNNCIAHERESSPLFTSDFGIATDELFISERSVAENVLESEITEALMSDPYGRTEAVNDITFVWGADSVQVELIVAGIEDATIDIETTIVR